MGRQEADAADDADAAACAAAREAAPGLRLAAFSACMDAHARLGPAALLPGGAPAALGEDAALQTRQAPGCLCCVS